MRLYVLVCGLAMVLLGASQSTLGASDHRPAEETDSSPAQPTADAGNRSLTILPMTTKPEIPVVRRNDGTTIDMSKRMAAVVGLFLEKAGIENIQLADKRFPSPDTRDVTRTARDLGTFIRETPIKTEYALYCEIYGTPKKGVEEIRTIVVDRHGKIILADRDDPRTYSRTSPMVPKDRMSCCVFVAKKLQGLWDLEDPLRNDGPQGAMAEYWRKQSGLPSERELAAMEKRREAMRKNMGKGTVTVYPIRIGSKTDKQCAAELADMLKREKLALAVASDVDPSLQIQGDPNQQKVLWDTAQAFRHFVQQNPPSSDYALYADYGIGRSSSGQLKVGHVHVIVCDRGANWVVVDFQNSHHPDFLSIDPRSRDDCNQLVVRRAKAALLDR